MELFKIQTHDLNQNQIEQVAPEKLEYKLIETYIRTSGLGLYCYNQFDDTISLVTETVPTKVRLIVIPSKDPKVADEVTYEEYEHKRCEVDARLYYFEALRLKSAIERVSKWKAHKIDTLCNLKVYNPNAKISFW